jgi:hypothetical protein
MPTQQEYYEDRAVAGGTFENQVLYRMCLDYPGHDDPYVTAGKIITIGRVYAASPERGAGVAVAEGTPLLRTMIAQRFREICLHEVLNSIGFETRFSAHIAQEVVNVHGLVNATVGATIRAWNGRRDEAFARESFASKYLHFHRPNAFPILDRYSREGVRRTFPRHRAGELIPANGNTGYARFCELVLRFVAQPNIASDWTPRSIDSALMIAGNRPNYGV